VREIAEGINRHWLLECEEAIEQILNKWEKEMKMEEPTQVVTSTMPAKKNGKGPQKKTGYNLSPYHFEAEGTLQRILGVNLVEIPGLDVNGIIKIIGEIGHDMSKWPTVKHFTSWLGLSPGNKISGGKILSGQTKPSANRAARALRIAANTLYNSDSALGAYFRRMRARLGAPKAITAAAHKLARILYTMLKERKSFTEIGQEAYEKAYKERQLHSLKKRALELQFSSLLSNNRSRI